jgi:hypothetical protein
MPPAHVDRWVDVEMNGAVRRAHVGGAVLEACHPGQVVFVAVVTRVLHTSLVNDGADASGPVGADGHPLPAGRAVSDHGVELLAGQHQFDRTTHLPGGKCCLQLMRPGFSGGTERSTHERRDDADAFFGDAEGLRIRLVRPRDSLHLVPDGELVTVPAGDGRRQLHGVVVVAGDRVPQVGRHRRAAKRRIRVPAGVILHPLVLARFRDRLRGVDVRQWLRCSAVADLHQGSAVRRGLERGAHHDRHRLTEGCDLAGVVRQCHAAEVGQDA